MEHDAPFRTYTARAAAGHDRMTTGLQWHGARPFIPGRRLMRPLLHR